MTNKRDHILTHSLSLERRGLGRGLKNRKPTLPPTWVYPTLGQGGDTTKNAGDPYGSPTDNAGRYRNSPEANPPSPKAMEGSPEGEK
jgi:hypothetical protein